MLQGQNGTEACVRLATPINRLEDGMESILYLVSP